MAYTPNTWVDRVANGDNRFTDQNNNVYEFTPAPISVSQNGTPFSAEWMNHIEQGIAANDAVATRVNKLLWSGSWSSAGNSGMPSSIPGISSFNAILVETSNGFKIPCFSWPSTVTTTNGFFGMGTGHLSASFSTSFIFMACTIKFSGDTAEDLSISTITLSNGVSPTVDGTTEQTIIAIYGIY